MSNQERIIIKPLQRKTKKSPQENKKEINVDEDNYGLSYFENDQEEFQTLSEEFFGKCILLDNKDDDEIQKRNKVKDNEFCQLNQIIQKNTYPIEIKNQEKQQSFKNDENFESLETRSIISDSEYFHQEDFLMIQTSEINYLQNLNYIQESVGLNKKQYNFSKQKLNNITNVHLPLKIQKKNILKINKKA
ncbi:unnamed protein product [Paramecium primaurelia]|uniref:Uncharacterized protein n=1 Tax=Paramecium primaurelia TaxID=5886 RepID=A0A8S1JWG8_PARPR|nr:unnamed protein product [Paramecium primaurelia]